MFTNPGNKIKLYSKVVFWVIEVIAILTSLVCLIGFIEEGKAVIGIVLAIIVLALYTFCAWITAIYMAAYGQMIEDIQKTAEETKKQNEILQESLKQIADSIVTKNQA